MPEPRRLVIWGASGHAKVVADAARLSGWTVSGFLDDMDPSRAGSEFFGARVLGTLEQWLAVRPAPQRIALGVGDNTARRKVFDQLRGLALEPVTVVHPGAIVAPSSMLGAGAVIFAGAIVNADVLVGDAVIVNTGARVDHDTVLEVACQISPGATLAGRVRICASATVGPGAVVGAGMTVGAGAVVGAGGVVVRDVDPGVLVYGVPARTIRKLEKPTDPA